MRKQPLPVFAPMEPLESILGRMLVGDQGERARIEEADAALRRLNAALIADGCERHNCVCLDEEAALLFAVREDLNARGPAPIPAGWGSKAGEVRDSDSRGSEAGSRRKRGGRR